MKIKTGVLAVYLLLTAVCSVYAKQPNFVVIFIDDMGYGDIGPFGAEINQTPELDRMADEGMKLTSFYVLAPVCTPSRAGLMTGCYPKRVGLARGSWGSVLFPKDTHGLNPDEKTIAEVLKDAGYSTGCFGKWHLGDQPEFLPTQHGFDTYYGIPYSNDMWPRHEPSKRWKNGVCPLPIMRGTNVVEIVADMDDQAELCRKFTEEAVSFIRENRDKPFFCYIPHAFVHYPRMARPEFMAKATAEGNKKTHEAQVEELDWSTGEILKTLRELGIADNTLVLFTSDNGSAGGSAGPLRGHKGQTWEGGMREPTIAWWPGTVPAGSVCDEIGSVMDFLPTFAALAGAKIPSDRVIDGKDITPLLLGVPGAKTPHEAFFYHQGDRLDAVRSGPWKLFVNGKLYNLETDIGEQADVASQHPNVVARLKRLMENFEAELTANSRPVGVAEQTTFLVSDDPAPQGDERLINGDFEIGVPQDDEAASFDARGWRRLLWKPHELNSWLTDGERDWQVGKGNQAAEFRWGATSICQLFSAAAGKQYQFGVDALNPADQESRWQPQIQVEWFNATGEHIGDAATVAAADNATSPRQTWHRIKGSAVAPAGTAYGRMLLNVKNTGRGNMWLKTYMDNASVRGQPGTHNLPVSFISSPYPLVLGTIPESNRYTDDLNRYAGDNDGDALRFSKISGPAWLTVQLDGTLAGTPAFDHAGDNVFVFKVTDDEGSTDTQTLTIPVIGQLRLSNLYDDDMVLQRGRALKVWGKAVPDAPVRVAMSTGEKAGTTADADGSWAVALPAMKASLKEPVTMTVISGPRTLTLTNLLVGDVWFCSGQSNMSWPLEHTDGAEEAIAAADHANLRMVKTPETGSKTPWGELETRAEWNVCMPSTVPNFSAVAYYFGRALLRETGIPIGLINSSQGGTRIEPWTGGPLYNARVHPYTRMPIKGVIWYQGEANLGDGLAYTDKMVKMVADWRSAWNHGAFPFYFVQLAPFKYDAAAPRQLPLLWEAQARAMETIPNSGMVVVNDVGNPDNIHPRNKAPVGERLARWALHHAYGQKNVEYAGPVVREIVREGSAMRVRFNHAKGGLASRDGRPATSFEVAGTDGNYVDAEAEIDDDAVIVSAPQVAEPESVRFAWRNTAEPNLMNKECLPAGAFRLHTMESTR